MMIERIINTRIHDLGGGFEVGRVALPSIVLGFVSAGVLLGLTILGGMRGVIEVPGFAFVSGLALSFALVLQGVFRVVRRGQILGQARVRPLPMAFQQLRPRRATLRDEVLRSVTPPGTRLPPQDWRSLATRVATQS